MLGFGAIGEAALGSLPDEHIDLIGANRGKATLIVPGLIIPDKADADGTLVRSYGNVWIEIARKLGKDWSLAFQLNPRNWEEIIAGAFHKDGFEVTLTPPAGDRGRDIIAVRKGTGSLRILGSMKAYAPNRVVTRAHVHEMLGVVSGDLRATKAFIATTSDFAPQLLSDPGLAQAIPFRVELKNGVELQTWLKELVGKGP